VREVPRVDDGARIVRVVTDDPAAAACPHCGVISTTVRQRRTTRPRDLPYGDAPVRIRWHKVQYACREPRCPRKAFTERIDEIPARARLTGRLRRPVAGRVADGLAVSTACGRLMSWPIGHAAFVAHADAQLPEPPPVRVLGIDETRRGRPVWRQQADGTWRATERFETNFVDLAGGHGLLGQTAGRTTDEGRHRRAHDEGRHRLAHRPRYGVDEPGADRGDGPVRLLPRGRRAGAAARDHRR
jgi:hypothetical protein